MPMVIRTLALHEMGDFKHPTHCRLCGQTLPEPGVELSPTHRKLWNILYDQWKKNPKQGLDRRYLAHLLKCKSEGVVTTHIHWMNRCLWKTKWHIGPQPHRLVQIQKPGASRVADE